MLRLLIADSDPAVCQTLRRYFSDQGHHVQTEENPFLLEPRIASYHPDLTFVDLSLADRSGVDIFSGIHERGFRSPIVFMTDLRNPEHARKVRVMDILSVIVKPFDYDQIDRIVSLIETQRRVRAVAAA